MRQTDSSQSAAAISAAEQTTPITAVRVSPPAACSRPTAGATCASTPAQMPRKTAPTYALACARTAIRATSIGSTGRTGAVLGVLATGRFPARASRRAVRRVASVRAPSASATASTPSGAGSHQSSGGSSP